VGRGDEGGAPPGRPVWYERNDAYVRWRRIDHIREDHSDQEIVEALSDAGDRIEGYRARFDADDPDDVSVVAASRELPTEDAWAALSVWEPLERRAALLEAARRDRPASVAEHTDA